MILLDIETHQFEVAIRSRVLSIKKRHHNKQVNKLRDNKRDFNTIADTPQLTRYTVHNTFHYSYILSRDE